MSKEQTPLTPLDAFMVLWAAAVYIGQSGNYWDFVPAHPIYQLLGKRYGFPGQVLTESIDLLRGRWPLPSNFGLLNWPKTTAEAHTMFYERYLTCFRQAPPANSPPGTPS